jgi:surface protein
LFKIKDSYGDGILVPGYYKVLVDGNEVLSGREFAFEESKHFEFFSQPSQSPSRITLSPSERIYPDFCFNAFDSINDYTIGSAATLYHDNKDAAVERYGPIESWDTSYVTDMEYLFKDKSAFNSDISGWDASRVTTMKEMFMNTKQFNIDISSWNVGKVVNFDKMFTGAASFCQDLCSWVNACGKLIEHDNISLKDAVDQYVLHSDPITRAVFLYGGCMNSWDTTKVTSMESLFYKKEFFNENIASWDVSSVTSMRWMFAYASKFDQDVSGWNVDKVSYMTEMFHSASSFNKNLCRWLLTNTNFPDNVDTFWMFEFSKCDITSYPTNLRVCHMC